MSAEVPRRGGDPLPAWVKAAARGSESKLVRRVDACILLQTIIACRNIRESKGLTLQKQGIKLAIALPNAIGDANHKYLSDCSGKNKIRAIGYYYSIEQKKMGCEQSQLREVDVNLRQEEGLKEDDKVMAVLEEVREAEEVEQQRMLVNDQSKENQSGVKSKEKKGKNHSQLQEDGKMKVKKARNYRIKPQHQKFIENIIESNRSKANTQYPTPTQKAPTLKKNASTSAHTKLDIIQSKSAVNETAEQKTEATAKEVKPVLCQKQLERRLNGMLHKIDEERENGVGLAIDLEMLDSSATLQL